VVRHGAKAGLTAAVVTIAVLTGSPALAATGHSVGTGGPPTTGTGAHPTGAGSTSRPATTTPGVGDEATLSPAELAAQIAAANALTGQLTATNAGIAAAATRLQRLAAQANVLLQDYAEARDAERKAREEANRNVALYQQMSTQLGRDRRALGQWAYQAYAGSGGTLGDMSALLSALTTTAEGASDTAAQLSYLSDQRGHAFDRVENQTQLQRDVAARAVEASTRATEAAAAAARAKAKLDVVIEQQQTQLEATRKLHAEQVKQAGPVAGLLLGSGDTAARDAVKRLRKALVVSGVELDGSVMACSTNEAEYPNGRLPASALCPLYGDPGQSLRPGAAAAFNAMSIAYEEDTGSPICVTDSYRSYAEQVLVKAAKGKWAAAPGTSEHGMGRAVDLCGGINNFGTAAHLWMKQNAPLYGWFHPDWAEPTGSLPEPWHWEFAG
jgi:zinc D-Ala-D-Ala carboxypeptidase